MNCLSLIIPMYNETAILPDTVATLRAFADSLPYPCEILLADDGSTDGSAELAKREIGDDPRFRVVGYPENKGKGGAVRAGMLSSTGDICVFTDCDLAYGTDYVRQIAQQLDGDASVQAVIGSRHLSRDSMKEYSLLRRMMSGAYLGLLRIAAGFRLSDSQCGIKAFRGHCAREIFSLCQVNSFAFDLEALMIADRLGYRVGEMAVAILNHRERGTKIRFFRDTARMLFDIRAIKKRIRHLSPPADTTA